MYGFEIPTDFEGLNMYNSMRSVAGKVCNDANTAYYMRALYHRILSGATFDLPDTPTWRQSRRYFKNVLYTMGFIGVVKTAKYGVVPQICNPYGYGLFLQPTNIRVTQPLVQFEGTIGEDCEVIHLTPDWRGVWDIVEHYAIRLSTAITSLDVSLINSRVSFLAGAKNKTAAETLKYLYEAISAGEPFKVYDKKFLKSDDLNEKSEPIWTYHQDVKNNYITDNLLADMTEILRMFDNEVGILAIGDKKERRITDEVEAISDDTCARASTWFENLSDSFDNVNRLFPELNLSFTFKYGGEDHVYNAKTDNDRTV